MAGGWGTTHVVEEGVFVPNGASRRDTAVLLVGTAKEFNLGRRAVKAANAGFYISDELAEILAAELPADEADDEPADEADDEAVTDDPTLAAAVLDSAVAEESNDEPEPDQGGDDPLHFDPADYKIPEIKTAVTDDPTLAAAVLDSEVAGKNRPSLVEWLRETITSGDRAVKNEAQEEE